MIINKKPYKFTSPIYKFTSPVEDPSTMPESDDEEEVESEGVTDVA